MVTRVNVHQVLRLLPLLLFLTGCLPTGQPLRARALTPSLAITEHITSNYSFAQDFKLLGTRTLPDGKVAGVYTYSESGGGSEPDTDYIGYAVAEQRAPVQWDVVVTSSTGRPHLSKWNLPIDYAVYQATYTAVFGPILSEDVTAVEVGFADGEVAREQVAKDYFLLFSPSGSDACQIQVIGSEAQVLYETVFSPHSEESDDCPESAPK